MKFRTEYSPIRAKFTLSPDRPVILEGSCFSQNIARRMGLSGWNSFNFTGTLYNPASICLAIDMLMDTKKGVERFENSLFEYNGIWCSERLDSSFSSCNREDSIMEFKNRQDEFLKTIEEAQALIVTFGSSLVYYQKEKEIPVGNCHKMPASMFRRKRMNVSSIFSDWEVLTDELSKKYPDLKFIFTVSPVRHLKDGFVENNRSKAILSLAIAEICMYVENSHYFPAYEILNDDLRDYRFYASDLAHPSEEAVEYIWEMFKRTYLDDKGIELLSQREKEIKAALHRPLTGALGKPLQKQ